LLILHPLSEEFPERIDRRFACKAIINVLIILVGLEPELVTIAQKQQAEQQENEDKSQGRLVGRRHVYTAGTPIDDRTCFVAWFVHSPKKINMHNTNPKAISFVWEDAVVFFEGMIPAADRPGKSRGTICRLLSNGRQHLVRDFYFIENDININKKYTIPPAAATRFAAPFREGDMPRKMKLIASSSHVSV
jgi:hypothetical protein